MTAAVNRCLTDDVVAAMIDGKLHGEPFSAAEEHLSSCTRCMRLIEAAGEAVASSDGARPLGRGTFLGRYEILEAIGAGGMGRVYAARDSVLDRKVALKLLHPSAASTELEERLLREAKAMARLSQPEVITVHDVGRHGNQLFIAMELVEGGTLRQWLADGPRTTEEIVAVFVQAARGLAASHDVGLVHRDFKPDNVLVRTDGRVLVSDFGLVRDVERSSGVTRPEPPVSTRPVYTRPVSTSKEADLDAGSDLTRKGTLLGTPAYMAPEQIAREAADARSDVYSFSVTLYEALYGARPFHWATLDAAREAMMGEVRFPPRTPAVPALVTKALHDGLQLDPALRPSMREMLARLEPRLARRGVSRAWTALALVTVALASAAAAVLVSRPHVEAPTRVVVDGRPRPSVAVLGLTAGSHPGDAWLGLDLAEVLRADLQGRDRGLRAIADDRVAHVFAEAKIDPAAPLDAEAIDALRERLDTDYLVVGSVEARGASEPRRLRAEVRLVDTARRAVVGVFRQEGTEDALADLGLALGAAMRARVGARQLSDEEVTAVRAKVPRSLAAANAYGLGLERLQAFDIPGGRAQLESAVAIEPSFVPAHARLARTLAGIGAMKQSREESRIAFSLADGLPSEERLDLESAYRARTRDWNRAIEVTRALVTFYPDDLDYGLLLSYIQVHAGRSGDALTTLDALHALPKPAGDDPRIDVREAEAATDTADYARAIRAGERASARAELVGSTGLEAHAQYWIAEALRHRGDYEQSLAHARESIRLAHASNDDGSLASSLVVTGHLLTDQGLFDEAQRDYEEARELDRKMGNDSQEEVTTNSLAEIADARDDVRGAEALFTEGREQASKNGSALHLATSACNLGIMKMELGDLPASIALANEGIAGFTAIGDVAGATEAHCARARTVFERGDTAAAVVELRGAIDAWGRIGATREEALAKIALASLLVADGHAKEAVDLCRAAVSALDANRKEGSRGPAHAGLAVALLATGAKDEARAEALAARAALPVTAGASERNAVGIGAGRVLGELGVPEDREAGMREVEDVVTRSRASGRLIDELYARLAHVEVDSARGHASDARDLAADAEAHGFVAVARAARRLAR